MSVGFGYGFIIESDNLEIACEIAAQFYWNMIHDLFSDLVSKKASRIAKIIPTLTDKNGNF